MNDEKTVKEYKTTKDLVLKILAQDEMARNSDKLLSYRVYERIAIDNGFKGIFIPFSIFGILPSFETISRVRRYYQNDLGLYPPTKKEVRNRRKLRQHTIETGGAGV